MAGRAGLGRGPWCEANSREYGLGEANGSSRVEGEERGKTVSGYIMMMTMTTMTKFMQCWGGIQGLVQAKLALGQEGATCSS